MTQPVEPTPADDSRGPVDPTGPDVLEDPLVRYDARVLDPTTAVRLTTGEPPAVTVYVGDTLLVTADSISDAEGLLTALDAAAAATDLPLRRVPEDPFQENEDPDHDRRARLLRLAAGYKLPLVFPVRFVPTTDGPAAAVDVWPLLQAIRQSGRPDSGTADAQLLSRAVGLNHLMASAAVISGNPYTRGMASIIGNPYTRGMATIGGNPYTRGMAGGLAGYLAPGSGGRGPVSVVVPPPLRSPKAARPHVVVLDTGVGGHPWFDAQAVTVGLQFADPADPNDPPNWIGMNPHDLDVERTDPEGTGSIPDPMTGLLASHAGHGTFIAGLIRQTCADADITAVRVMDSDGVVPELMLTDALSGLAVVQSGGPTSIDALVLSLGYYSETGDDVTYTAGLRPLVLALAALGVAIFCAAGNDSTMRRSYPAAFADDPAFQDGDHLPLASVAALNPDSTVALFSNEGDWVTAEAPGANLVSTAPRLAQGSWNPDTSFIGPGRTRRGTVDPDSFVAGFATWSGTSFAAPVLAGRYLARLAEKEVARTVPARRPLIGLGRTRVS